MSHISRRSLPLTPPLKEIAESEIEQGRACLFIYAKADNLEKIPLLLSLGFKYLEKTENKDHRSLFNPKMLYKRSDIILCVCIPQEPDSLFTLPLHVLKEIDPDGSLLMEILTLNTPYGQPLKGHLATALLAATFEAGLFGESHRRKGQVLLQSVPVKTRETALTYGLSFASEESNLLLCEIFLKWGAKPNSNNYDDGTTPLEAAVLEPNIELARLLLSYGANPDMRLVSGSTCRKLAKSEGLKDMSELFRLRGNLP